MFKQCEKYTRALCDIFSARGRNPDKYYLMRKMDRFSITVDRHVQCRTIIVYCWIIPKGSYLLGNNTYQRLMETSGKETILLPIDTSKNTDEEICSVIF